MLGADHVLAPGLDLAALCEVVPELVDLFVVNHLEMSVTEGAHAGVAPSGTATAAAAASGTSLRLLFLTLLGTLAGSLFSLFSQSHASLCGLGGRSCRLGLDADEQMPDDVLRQPKVSLDLADRLVVQLGAV